MVGDELETDAPVEKVTPRDRKVLDGVFVPDFATAKTTDKFTRSPKGHDGYFMRMRHVIRPQGDVAFSKVSGSSTVQHVTESDFARALAAVTVGW